MSKLLIKYFSLLTRKLLKIDEYRIASNKLHNSLKK